jgi:hypothetical protein
MLTVIGFLPLLPGSFRKTRAPQTHRSDFGTPMKQRGNSVQMRTFVTHLHRDIPDQVFRGNRIPLGSTPLDVLCCKLLFATRLLTPGSETTACHLFCSRH